VSTDPKIELRDRIKAPYINRYDSPDPFKKLKRELLTTQAALLSDAIQVFYFINFLAVSFQLNRSENFEKNNKKKKKRQDT
jgi:hypothetical protein